jgi:hypothetical protein
VIAAVQLPLKLQRVGALTEVRSNGGKSSWLAFSREWVMSSDDRADLERFVASLGNKTLAPRLAELLGRCDAKARLCAAMVRDMTSVLLGVPSQGLSLALFAPGGPPPFGKADLHVPTTIYFDGPAAAQRAAEELRGTAKDAKKSAAVRKLAAKLVPEVRGATVVVDLVAVFELESADMQALQADMQALMGAPQK